MILTSDNPLGIIAVSVVADVQATSRFADRDNSNDVADITTTLVLQEPERDLVIPTRVGEGIVTQAESSGQVVRLRSERSVAPAGGGRYHLRLTIPDPEELFRVADGTPFSVLVLLPPSPTLTSDRPLLVDWTREKNPIVYGSESVADEAEPKPDRSEPIASRPAIAWFFDVDATIDVIWRYVGAG